eukprot:CAMPEP_0175065436 /NCGR_PEP_ID=MMETSP0052_2-20121109/15922_1 /TAXON_ID=51329 ORGANISM="Polytomella parva, Strain SAG 63-3" /NCGR_SAMPLE_ID=MMETSP0052_2 /ASSEMBLY_ACC=CAM_ASM_000194 /LENGTH=77 /DNA_ID=CAMNT_0016331967 /DNA_START=1065 /DNA_END=1293 /DNA_ORIENTATION=-
MASLTYCNMDHTSPGVRTARLFGTEVHNTATNSDWNQDPVYTEYVDAASAAAMHDEVVAAVEGKDIVSSSQLPYDCG